MSAEARLKQLGLTLPQVPAPLANYLPYRIAGNLLFLAGQGARGPDGSSLTGKVGGEVSVDEGYKRARLVGLQLLSATRMALGSLDRVDVVVKMLCMVNAVPISAIIPRSPTACPTSLSKYSATPANTRAQRLAWARYPIRSRLRSRACWRSNPDRPSQSRCS